MHYRIVIETEIYCADDDDAATELEGYMHQLRYHVDEDELVRATVERVEEPGAFVSVPGPTRN
jgi:hypothetical protein